MGFPFGGDWEGDSELGKGKRWKKWVSDEIMNGCNLEKSIRNSEEEEEERSGGGKSECGLG